MTQNLHIPPEVLARYAEWETAHPRGREILENSMLPADYAGDLTQAMIRERFRRLEWTTAAMANGSRIFTGGDGTEAAFEGHSASLPPFIPVGRAARQEVDYARDLGDAPTFAEALAALETHKARRRTQ